MKKLASAFISFMMLMSFSAINAHSMTIEGYPTPQQLRSVLGTGWLVFLDGEIGSDTAKRFREYVESRKVSPNSHIIINSPGGSLIGGIELGRAIRSYNFTTDIGVKSIGKDGTRSYDPGSCLSSCALAFIGGTFRFVRQNSKYGVHRF